MDLTSPSSPPPRRYDIPPPVRGAGSFIISHAYLDKATDDEADGMAAQLIAEAPDDEAGSFRLVDFAIGAFALQRWSIGIRVGREIRRRGFAQGDRQCRYWALREVVNWSPIFDPRRPWPPPDVRADLVPLLDVAALIAFGLEGDPATWGGNESLNYMADAVIDGLNNPWRMVRT